MKKYSGFTLLELIIVMVVMLILSTISVLSYRSLVDSFSMNEVSLTIAQDIRGTQRVATMLGREADERWLHGIGIDFTELEDEGSYNIFKWCSSSPYYDASEPSLTNEVPNLDGVVVEDARISLNEVDACPRDENIDAMRIIETKKFGEYNNLEFSLETAVRYVLFESVSGKAFFYDENGKLLNYNSDGGIIYLNDTGLGIELFEIKIAPTRRAGLNTRSIVLPPVSGIVHFKFD